MRPIRFWIVYATSIELVFSEYSDILHHDGLCFMLKVVLGMTPNMSGGGQYGSGQFIQFLLNYFFNSEYKTDTFKM